MSLKDNNLLSSLTEKGKEVATHTITEVKSSSKTVKVLLVLCIIGLVGLGYAYYNLASRNVELDALKQENIAIQSRMRDIDSSLAKINFQYVEISNKVLKIDENLKTKLNEAKEVVVHEVKTSGDIVSVLDELSDLTTGK